MQVFYPWIKMSFLSEKLLIPIEVQGDVDGAEGINCWMSYPPRFYAQFLFILNPEIKKSARGMIYNFHIPFKCRDFINPSNRHLVDMTGLRWLFTERFSLKESDQRSIIYDPDYFLNLSRPQAFGR